MIIQGFHESSLSEEVLLLVADPAYADTLLQHARQLYDFGYHVRETYHHKIPDAEDFYPYVSQLHSVVKLYS